MKHVDVNSHIQFNRFTGEAYLSTVENSVPVSYETHCMSVKDTKRLIHMHRYRGAKSSFHFLPSPFTLSSKMPGII
jgi:hypothetical protein